MRSDERDNCADSGIVALMAARERDTAAKL
jgi:hypothetical protein